MRVADLCREIMDHGIAAAVDTLRKVLKNSGVSIFTIPDVVKCDGDSVVYLYFRGVVVKLFDGDNNAYVEPLCQ